MMELAKPRIRNLKRHKAAGTHCQLCGRKNPELFEGYTVCCNEPICYSSSCFLLTFESWNFFQEAWYPDSEHLLSHDEYKEFREEVDVVS